MASDRSTGVGDVPPTTRDETSFGIASHMRTTTRINSLFTLYAEIRVYIAHLYDRSDRTIPPGKSVFSIISGRKYSYDFLYNTYDSSPFSHTFRYSPDRVRLSILLQKLASRVSLHN